MISAFLSGIGSGLVLAILVGPIFFSLLQTSIQRGFRRSIYFIVGVTSSDILLILLTYFGISILLKNKLFEHIFTLVGGIVTFTFGAYYLFGNSGKKTAVEVPVGKSRFSIAVEGFYLNFFNPSVLFFWIATIGIVSVNYNKDPYRILSFFSGIILTLLATDITKAYVAHKIKVYFTEKLLLKFNKIVGIVFMIAGILILRKLWV
jgi:threonine/homoserine/homoserine lactone efflux protein